MGFLDNLNTFNSAVPGDGSDIYANLNKLTIEFYHLPSDKTVSFKAYLTSWDDKFTSNYNSEEVFGRNDHIHTFQGTHREIQVAWDVVAGSVKEAQENLARVSLLAQFLYPAYKMETLNFSVSNSGLQGTAGSGMPLQVGTMTKAPLIKVRFANLIVDSKGSLDTVSAKETGLLCAMDGLTITADLEAGVIDGTGVATPKVFKLTTTLKVLHQHTLGWDNDAKSWLGTGAEGYPYNAWGSNSSNSRTFAGLNPAPATPPPGTTGTPAQNEGPAGGSAPGAGTDPSSGAAPATDPSEPPDNQCCDENTTWEERRAHLIEAQAQMDAYYDERAAEEAAAGGDV